MIKPRNNIIIIEKEEDQNVSRGGIIKPKVHKKEAATAVVVSVGSGSFDDEQVFRTPGVKAGDRIAYDINFRKTFKIDGEDVVMLKAEGIFGILPPLAS